MDINSIFVDNEKLIKSVAIIGSRTFNDYNIIKDEFLKITNNIIVSKIISGGALGADKIGEKIALEFNIPITIFKPDWSLGKHAGFLRNSDIVINSDIIIAFWNGISKGTHDSIKKAKKLKKELYIIKI